ncbi:MAG: class I adenylate-forming enzyme family protein [Pseudomonadota bacterium]
MGSAAQAIDVADIEVRKILDGLPDRLHRALDRAAAETPDYPALIDDSQTWSYRQLSEAIQATASALQALGVRPGDRIMLVSENCIEMACLMLAASELNAWVIVSNPRLSPRELDQIRDHSGARRMFFTARVSPEAANHAARVNAQIGKVGPLSDIGIGELNQSTQPEPVEDDPTKQVAVLIYTSGTTGAPKGVMLTHGNLLFSAKGIAQLRHMTSEDKVYVVLPMSHIVGVSLIVMTLLAGATARLVSKYDPAAFARHIAEEGITTVNGVPATYQRLLEYKQVAGLSKLDRGSLRLIAVAGAPLDLDLKTRVEAELGIPLLNAYGITETSPGISGVRLESPRTDQSVGDVMPGVESRIVGRDGRIITDGSVGELHVRGRNVMLGYYRAPDLTAKAVDADGWFLTGDLARLEGDALFIVGRSKEMIIRSGFNVYPAEVEAVLNSHDAVVQSAVVGRTVDGNEEVVAFVQLLNGSNVTPSELMAYVSPQLTSYKRPSQIIVLEALPATSTGKILKHKLAESLRET